MHSHRDLIARALEDHPVPQEAAAKALAEADDEQVAELAREGAVYLARMLVRRGRKTSTTPTGQSAGDTHSGIAGGGRWPSAADDSWDLTLPYYTGDGWKPLGDCTADDLEFIAEQYEVRASQNDAHARRFRSLAGEVRAAGATTVAALEAVAA